MNYQKYVVAYIDILGFKDLVNKSKDNAVEINSIYNILKEFYHLQTREAWEKAKILMDIEEDAQVKELDEFYVEDLVFCNSFSDCIVIAIKGDCCINERTSALIAQLAKISNELLRQGLLTRGCITYGDFFIDENEKIFFGESLNKAYLMENTVVKYPRILITKELLSELNYPLLSKRDRMPYHQYIDRFDDGTIGFTPLIFFQVCQYAPNVFNNQELIKALLQAKQSIMSGLDENADKPNIYEKYKWLMDCYNNLIILETDLSKIYSPNIADARQNVYFSHVHEYYRK